jgi:hypothetical protein
MLNSTELPKHSVHCEEIVSYCRRRNRNGQAYKVSPDPIYPLTTILIFFRRIAQEKVAERFSSGTGPGSAQMDMLQSFINHGLSEDEAVSESLIQM